MSARLIQITRHPIKSIGRQDMESAGVLPNAALPFDRFWAVLHERSKVQKGDDGRATVWGKKVNFLTTRAAPELTCVTCDFNETAGQITLHHPRQPSITVTEREESSLLDWLAPLLPQGHAAPTALVRACGHSLSDEPEPFLSLLNTASLTNFATHFGQPVERERFRGNLWVEGWAARHEQSLIGKSLKIGNAEFIVVEPIMRCSAVDADPKTATKTMDTLAELRKAYGDQAFGVFLKVTKPGTIALNDTIEVI